MFLSCSLMNSMNLFTLCSLPIFEATSAVFITGTFLPALSFLWAFKGFYFFILKISTSHCNIHFNTRYGTIFSSNSYRTTHFLQNNSTIRNYICKSEKETKCPSINTWSVMEKNTNIHLYGKDQELLFY